MLVALVWSGLAFGGEIHDAAAAGDLEKVKALLKDKHNLVFSKDSHGATPLLLAVSRGHKEVAEVLLANKAEVNAKNNEGGTPLHWAASLGNKDMAELLLANGADVNATNNVGKTPLNLTPKAPVLDRVQTVRVYSGPGVFTTLNSSTTYGGDNGVAELLRQHGGHE